MTQLKLEELTLDQLQALEKDFLRTHGKSIDSWGVTVYNRHAAVVNEIYCRKSGISREMLAAEHDTLRSLPDTCRIKLVCGVLR